MSVWLKRVFLAGAMLALLAGGSAEAQNGRGNGADGNVVNLRAGQVIPGQYIVVLYDDVADPAAVANEMALAHGLGLGHVYGHALKGFSATFPAGAVAALSRDPRVDYIEADQVVHAFAQDIPTGIERIFAVGNGSIDIDGVDDWRVDVDVAVIDTGIDLDHPDLNVVGAVSYAGGAGDDGNGHGTHVAGTIGALDNGIGVVGVAPGARLWAVKVLNNGGSGSYADVIAGINYVTANAATIEVANMSLGGGHSNSVCQAVANSVAAGVVHVVAAGNSDSNVTGHSPADCAAVITVSALADFDGAPLGLGSPTCRSDQDDTLANFSNWGNKVEVTAPGVCIRSTWKGGGYRTISGTSMASPHVAGAAALLASGANDPTNATQVNAIIATIIATGNTDSLAAGGWDDDSGDNIQEPLLDVTGFSAATVPGTVGGAPLVSNDAPQVTITSPVDGSDFVDGDAVPVNFAGTASDTEDGDLTANLSWSSNIDGALGTGGSVSTTLTQGPHTITAEVTDSGDVYSENIKSGNASISITVGDLPELSVVSPSGETGYSTGGGRNHDKHLYITVAVDPLTLGASVSIKLTRTEGGEWNGTGATDEFGEVTFSLKNSPAGCYTTEVTDLNGTLPATPANEFCK